MFLTSYLFNSTGYPLFHENVIEGKGCYVTDAQGKKYLDFEAGVWALPLGHCDSDVNKAMQQQLDEISHVGYKYNHSIVEKSAEKLCQIAQMENGKCVFLTSGSEAIEYGIQVAQAIRPGKQCISLKGQYLAAYGQGWQRDNLRWQQIEWTTDNQRTPNDWYEFLQHQYDFKSIGVFVFEPGNTSGLTKLPSPHFIKALALICEENHIVTVVDEVTCGLGRTGKWFGFMHYDHKPAIIAVGKGLGNGYPVSAVILSRQTIDEVENTGFHFAQSHQNDPMGARVAYEVVSKIETADLLLHTDKIGQYLRDRYAVLQKEISIIREIRGIGLMNCIELDNSVSEEAMREIDHQLFEQGIIAGVKPKERVVRTYCPLIVSKEMIDRYLWSLRIVLQCL